MIETGEPTDYSRSAAGAMNHRSPPRGEDRGLGMSRPAVAPAERFRGDGDGGSWVDKSSYRDVLFAHWKGGLASLPPGERLALPQIGGRPNPRDTAGRDETSVAVPLRPPDETRGAASHRSALSPSGSPEPQASHRQQVSAGTAEARLEAAILEARQLAALKQAYVSRRAADGGGHLQGLPAGLAPSLGGKRQLGESKGGGNGSASPAHQDRQAPADKRAVSTRERLVQEKIQQLQAAKALAARHGLAKRAADLGSQRADNAGYKQPGAAYEPKPETAPPDNRKHAEARANAEERVASLIALRVLGPLEARLQEMETRILKAVALMTSKRETPWAPPLCHLILIRRLCLPDAEAETARPAGVAQREPAPSDGAAWAHKRYPDAHLTGISTLAQDQMSRRALLQSMLESHEQRSRAVQEDDDEVQIVEGELPRAKRPRSVPQADVNARLSLNELLAAKLQGGRPQAASVADDLRRTGLHNIAYLAAGEASIIRSRHSTQAKTMTQQNPSQSPNPVTPQEIQDAAKSHFERMLRQNAEARAASLQQAGSPRENMTMEKHHVMWSQQDNVQACKVAEDLTSHYERKRKPQMCTVCGEPRFTTQGHTLEGWCPVNQMWGARSRCVVCNELRAKQPGHTPDGYCPVNDTWVQGMLKRYRTQRAAAGDDYPDYPENSVDTGGSTRPGHERLHAMNRSTPPTPAEEEAEVQELVLQKGPNARNSSVGRDSTTVNEGDSRQETRFRDGGNDIDMETGAMDRRGDKHASAQMA